jgi:hypothetical protein
MNRSVFSWLRTGSGRKPARRAARPRSFVPRLLSLEDRTLPSTFLVRNLADAGPGSLRQAILDADSAGGQSAITLAVTGTVTLQSALPDLGADVNIEGPGPGSLTVARSSAPGTPAFGILTVDANAHVTVSGVILANGGGALYGGGIFNNGGTLAVHNCAVVGNSAWRGGGLINFGNLVVSDSTLSGNTAANDGGGIANFGPLTVIDSSLTGNFGEVGGAIYNFYMATLAISGSTLSANSANDGGGIANNEGTVAVSSSTVASNTAEIGGGLFNASGGTATVTASTFASNTASYSAGGGIYNQGGAGLTVSNSTLALNQAVTGGGIANDLGAVLAVTSSTIAGNRADRGGGIANDGGMTAGNTILAGNAAPMGSDLAGDLGSLGHNLVGNTEGGNGFAGTDLLDADPRLGPLQDNGGPTRTMMPLPGSPAQGAGDTTGAAATDQRGFARIVGGTMDIGACERQPAGWATRLTFQAPATIQAGTPFAITVIAGDDFGQPAAGYLGTVHFTASNGAMATYPFQPADQGTHTFPNLVLRQAGTITVTGTDTADPAVTGGTSITIGAAAADHLVFLQPPRDTPAGHTMSPVVVAVVDQYGNVETGDTSDLVTLSLSTNSDGGTLSGTLTMTVSGGLATFSDLSIDLAGMGYTLHASVGGGLPDIDSGPFTIS